MVCINLALVVVELKLWGEGIIMGYLENKEFKIIDMEVNEIDKLLNKFCAKEERIKDKLRQLIEVENDTSLVFELESLIAIWVNRNFYGNHPEIQIFIYSIIRGIGKV